MDIEEWIKRFKVRLTERGLSEKEVRDVAEASVRDPDFLNNDDPEQAADDELSYWTDDG